MYQTGLVSVSFRDLTPEEVLAACQKTGLDHIEWGSDSHAPYDDPTRLAEIAALQKQYGVTCCSYGTYFRLGETPMEELLPHMQAAKILGTDILRLWCAHRPPQDFTPHERDELFAQCRQAAKLAQEQGVTLCLECHRKTYTETVEGALEVMEAVSSPAFRMYWQPNQGRTVEENVRYARAIGDYVTHIHVFQWKGKERFSLAEGLDEWKRYLSEIPGDHTLLLEFMPDDNVQSLPAEADALRELIGE